MLLAQAGVPDAERRAARPPDAARPARARARRRAPGHVGGDARPAARARVSFRGGPRVSSARTARWPSPSRTCAGSTSSSPSPGGPRAGPDPLRPGPPARQWYYTGTVFEVYDPAVGYALGGGRRPTTLRRSAAAARLRAGARRAARAHRAARGGAARMCFGVPADDRRPPRRAVPARRWTCSTRSA